MANRRLGFFLAATVLALGGAFVRSTPPPDTDAQIDHVFARWTGTTPGCAVGAEVDERRVVAKAYGMADLEHDVRNTADTIFEAGSVSKQFTAAAVLLLAHDGKLSLDDPIRKYVPELPEYPSRITIRHMLNHSSGLRDWGSIEAIAGWPRTSRAYTHAHVLDILARQQALNFPAGTRWSYSNSGYNLAAIIVSRVSGTPFAEFTKRRIFDPVGMSHTSWRDDHTRIVRNRAMAYADRPDGFHTDMPFEDVHGNGGLLTTVGDLLIWNDHFTTPRIGDSSFVAEQQQRGHFNDGRQHGYALGLFVGKSHGVDIVEHSGSTAGYNAHLLRYPGQRVSVAVLCNSASATATRYAHEVADVLLADRVKPAATTSPAAAVGSDALDRASGLYRDTHTGMTLNVERDAHGLRIQRGPALTAASATRFVSDGGDSFDVDTHGARLTDAYGTVSTYERVQPAHPTRDELAALAGTYVSDEAETVLTLAVDGDALVVKRRPDTVLKLTPVYADAFTAPQLGLVIVRRDANGRATGLSVVEDRVWDLRFRRQPAAAKAISQ